MVKYTCSLTCLMALLTFLSLVHLSTSEPSTPLLGVALDSSHATAAYFGEHGPVLVSAVHANQAYQEYMYDTYANDGNMILKQGTWYLRLDNGTLLPKLQDDHDSEQAEYVFADLLQAITARAEEEVGRNITLGAISRPRHLNDSSLEALHSAAEKLDRPINTPLRFQRSHLGAFLTYPESDCYETWGKEDRIEDDEGVVVLVERDFGHLMVMYAKLARWGSGIWESRIVKRSVKNVGEAAETILETTFEDDINAIFLSGNFADTEATEISTILSAANSSLAQKLKGSPGSPKYVHAIGAACYAKYLVEHPRYLRENEPHYQYTDHDEV